MQHFGTIDFARQDRAPLSWPRVIAAHLDSLDPPVEARDLALLEQAARGIAAVIYADRVRVQDLLRGARDRLGRVAIDGQKALIEAVRARVAG